MPVQFTEAVDRKMDACIANATAEIQRREQYEQRKLHGKRCFDARRAQESVGMFKEALQLAKMRSEHPAHKNAPRPIHIYYGSESVHNVSNIAI